MASTDASDFIAALKEADLVGLSEYNPGQLKNNCVFVNIAYLLGKNNVDELDADIVKEMKKLQVPIKKPGGSSGLPGGLPFLQIAKILDMTGMQFVFKSWRSQPVESLVKLEATAKGSATASGSAPPLG